MGLGSIGRRHLANLRLIPDWCPGSDYRPSVSARRNLGGGAALEFIENNGILPAVEALDDK